MAVPKKVKTHAGVPIREKKSNPDRDDRLLTGTYKTVESLREQLKVLTRCCDQLIDRIDSLQSQVSFLVEREQERRAKEAEGLFDKEEDDEAEPPFQEGQMVQFQKFGNTIHGEVVKVGKGDNGLCVGVCWVEDRRGKVWAVSEEDLAPFTPPKAPKKKGRK